VFLIVFLDLIGFGLLLPLLPLFVAAAGGTPAVVGAMLATFSASQLVSTPVLGRWADRWGRRRVILLGLAGNSLAMALFALAAAQGSLELGFASRLLAGITAGTLGACQAAISDVTSGDHRSRAMGLVGAAIGLGMILGPLLGSVLGPLGLWAPPLAACVLAMLALGGVYLRMPETAPAHAPASQARLQRRASSGRPWLALAGRRGILAVLVLYVAVFAVLAALHTTLPLLAHVALGWHVREVGITFAAMGLGSLLVQGVLIGPLVARFGASSLVTVGFAVLAVALTAIASAGTTSPLVGGALIAGVAAGLVLPSLATVASDLAGIDERGAVLGLAQSSGGLGRTIGPLGAGMVHATLGPAAAVLSGAVLAGLALPLAAALARHTRSLHHPGSQQ